MLYHKTIKSFIALLMLVVFAFSITSQKTIHDLIAKHTDKVRCDVHKDLPIDQLENSTIHCSHENLVVASPFVDFSFQIILSHPIIAVVRNTRILAFNFSAQNTSLESRGPPVA
jgi:hypothetical protein